MCIATKARKTRMAIKVAAHSQPLSFSLIATSFRPGVVWHVGTIYLVQGAPRKERRLLHASLVVPSTREGDRF